jgi:hypothetical protein
MLHFIETNIDKEQLSAIAFTQGPGLMGHFWWEVLLQIDGFGLIHTSCISKPYASPYFSSFHRMKDLKRTFFSSDYKRWTYSDCSSKWLLQHDYYRRNYWRCRGKHLIRVQNTRPSLSGGPSWSACPIGNPKAFVFTNLKFRVWTLVFSGLKQPYCILYKS